MSTYRKKGLFKFGDADIDVSFVGVCALAALLVLFSSFQHANIASFVPTAEFATSASIWSAVFFIGMVGTTGLIRAFGAHPIVSIAVAFLLSHVALVIGALLPHLLSQVYLLTMGSLGLLYSLKAIIQRNSIRVYLCVLSILVSVPILWLTIAWLLFALPHSNYFVSFTTAHSAYGIIDYYHQLAYIRMIDGFGIPSVGMNGLGYHQYHWLIGYPLSTLSGVSGDSIRAVHANLLPGFTGPVLIHGVLAGFVLGCRRLPSFLLAISSLVAVYVMSVLTLKAISYGISFISPSSAYSLGLLAPAVGMFIWFYSGNLARLRVWHFLLFLGFLIMVGLAKVTSVVLIGCLIAGLWLPFVFRKLNSILKRLAATGLCALAAVISLLLVWEGLRHSSKDIATPEAYELMVEKLSDQDANLLALDVSESYFSKRGIALQETDFESAVFWRQPGGFALILLTLVLPLFWFVRHKNRRFRSALFLFLTLVLIDLILFERVFFGRTRPTQSLYILTPVLLLAVMAFAVPMESALRAKFRQTGLKSSKRDYTGLISAGAFLFILLIGGPIVGSHLNNKVGLAAAGSAQTNIGLIANKAGRQVIAQITAQRASSFGLGEQPTWPVQSARFWNMWEVRSMQRQFDGAIEFLKENPKSALFLSADDKYWSSFERSGVPLQIASFWVPANLGLPFYRGVVNRSGKSFSSRGFGDFAITSGSPVTLSEHVYCWRRFDGFTIIDKQGNIITTC